MRSQIQLGDIGLDVVRKNIRNIHLSVHPPTGKVRIAAPEHLSLDTIRVFAIAKLGWIRAQQRKLGEQEREAPREYLERESHWVWGRRYLLKIVEGHETPAVELSSGRIILRVRPGWEIEQRRKCIEAWYRVQVRDAVPRLIAKWERVLGVSAAGFFRAAHEDEMGELQSEGSNHSPQHRPREETGIVSRIHRGSRDGSPSRTNPQRALRRANGSVHAEVAAPPRSAEPAAGAARELGILNGWHMAAVRGAKRRAAHQAPAGSRPGCPDV